MDIMNYVGWGAMSNDPYLFPDILQKAAYVAEDNDCCNELYQADNWLDSTMLCAFDYRVDACQGDSGYVIIK